MPSAVKSKRAKAQVSLSWYGKVQAHQYLLVSNTFEFPKGTSCQGSSSSEHFITFYHSCSGPNYPLFYWVLFCSQDPHLYSSWQVMFRLLPWGISLPKPETGTTFLQCCSRRSQSGKSADLSTCQSSLTFTGTRWTCHLAPSGRGREG